MDTATYLKTAAGALDPHAILRQKPSVLLGVSDAAAQALADVEIKTVFDLALSRIFGNATAILNAGITQRDPITGFGAPPNDAVSDGLAGIAIEELRSEPISILEGIGTATATALEKALDVKSVRDLALWPPYLSSRAILAAAFFPDEVEGADKEAPADLVPRSGEYPTERIQYTTLVLDEIEGDVSLLTALEDAGPIDISPSATADFGFKTPGVGALLTFNQSWYAQGVALGHLLHSVALAPGESTRIAMVDWSRRTRASTSESLSESEALANATEHSRALSEVQQAVATEAQSGFSKTTSTASSSESGGGFGFSLGPVTLGGSSSGATSTTTAESFSSSFGRRDLEASMSQNVMDRTQQNATAVRNRRASIVREVSQSEQETVSTRVVANYNHMHALSIQYYEVIQVYRVAVRLSQVDKCLFIPMKLLDFRNQALVEKYRMALAAAALGERYRRLLTTEYGVVAITPNTPRASPGSIASALGVSRFMAVEGVAAKAAPVLAAEAVAAPAVASVASVQSVATEVQAAAAEAATPLTMATAAAALRGWDLAQISDVSRIVDRAVLRRGADELSLPDDVALTGFFLRDAQLGKARLELRDGSAATISVAAGSVAVGTPTGLGSLGSISLDNPSDKDVRPTLVLQLDHLGRRFTLDVPISLRGGQPMGKVVSFGATRASGELIDHLEANRLHYSQAVFRRMDASTIALLLSPYEYEGAPVTQLIDPLPIATPGNFLVFRMHADANDGAATGTRDGAGRRARSARGSWQKWLADHGISMSAVQEDIVPLPSGGVFAEAVLGRFNAAEKLDITRFWNWQDSPIPLLPTDIAADHDGVARAARESDTRAVQPAVGEHREPDGTARSRRARRGADRHPERQHVPRHERTGGDDRSRSGGIAGHQRGGRPSGGAGGREPRHRRAEGSRDGQDGRRGDAGDDGQPECPDRVRGEHLRPGSHGQPGPEPRRAGSSRWEHGRRGCSGCARGEWCGWIRRRSRRGRCNHGLAGRRRRCSVGPGRGRQRHRRDAGRSRLDPQVVRSIGV